jgi:hypothetical protein
VDLNKWQLVYKFILSFIKEFRDILEILQSDEQQDYTPPLITKPPGKPGLIHLFYNLIPNGIGLHIHQQLNQEQVRLLKNFEDYLLMFQQVSTACNDCCILFEINAKRLDSTTIINDSGEFKKNVSQSPSLPISQHQSSNRSSPYNNPYVKPASSHNNLYQLRQNNFDNADSNYNARLSGYNEVKERIFQDDVSDNHYNKLIDEDVYDFDFSEASDIANADIVISHDNMNPMYTDSAPDTLTNNGRLYALVNNTSTADLPCFLAARGECMKGNTCNFSHDDNELRVCFQKQMADLQRSPYNKGTLGYPPPVTSSRSNPNLQGTPKALYAGQGNTTRTPTRNALHTLNSMSSLWF